MSGTKAKSQGVIANSTERIREIGQGVTNVATQAAKNEAAASGKSFIEQLLGLNLDKQPSTKQENHEKPAEKSSNQVLFSREDHKPSTEKPKAHIEAAMNYSNEIAKSSERASKTEVREMQRNIQEIKEELNKLLNSSKELSMQFAQAATEQAPIEVGKYHLNFFEWMLAVIRVARQKVEDSGAWLNTVKGKGSKKGYWGMAQKHGTTFSMSNERSVATQVG